MYRGIPWIAYLGDDKLSLSDIQLLEPDDEIVANLFFHIVFIFSNLPLNISKNIRAGIGSNQFL